MKTRFDRDIVEAAGIDASAYSDEQIANFAAQLMTHPAVVKGVGELARRSFAAEVIAGLTSDEQQASVVAKNYQELHATILRQCGQSPLALK